MTKYAKLAIAPDGSIVSRDTGAITRVSGLSVVGNRVYRDGRLYGYTSAKLTAKQQAKIEKASVSREKKRASQAFKKMQTNRALPNLSGNFTVDASVGEGLRKVYNKYGRGFVDVSTINQATLNYANVLKAGIKDGTLTKEQADALYDKYLHSQNDDERRRLWNSTNAMFDKYGVKYKVDKPRIEGEDDIVDIKDITGFDVKEYWKESQKKETEINLTKMMKFKKA